jgi:hypothetical protein
MALPILTITDFTGRLKIGQNASNDLDDVISEFEPLLILEVLNANCLQEIEAETLKSKYVDLLAGGYYTNKNGVKFSFTGLKEWLKNRIYAEYYRKNFNATPSGLTNNLHENSVASNVKAIIDTAYNQAAFIYKDHLLEFLEEFEQIETIVTNSVDNSGSYTLSVPNTKYLYANDTVTIEGYEYTVFAVVDNVSITIVEATSELNFNGKEVVWKPFFELEEKEFPLAWL